MPNKVVLESAALQFAEATANPPYLFDLGPEKGLLNALADTAAARGAMALANAWLKE